MDEAVKTVLDEALGEIPVVGGLIKTLVDLFWPEPTQDVWDQIRDRVEQAIGQKLDTRQVNHQTEILEGLHDVVTAYQQAVADDPDDTGNIQSNYVTARDLFIEQYGTFADKCNPVLMLPLFGPFMDLYLALLRDGALFGGSWGWNDKLVADEVKRLDDVRKKAIDWVDTTYAAGLAAFDPPQDLKHGEPRRTTYIRTMTRSAIDHRHFWPYFVASLDVQRPGPLANEVYADLIGEVSAEEPQRLVHVLHNDRLTGLHLGCHGYNSVRVDAIAIDYGGVFGAEEGDTSAPVTTELPLGWSGLITPDNPLIGISGDANGTTLVFKNGTVEIGRPLAYEAGTYAAGPYDGQIVSSLTLTGVSGLGGLGGISVGFRYEDSYPPLPDPIEIDWVPWSAAPEIAGVTPQSLEHAKAAAQHMGGRLASRDQLYVAWWKSGYEQFAFGMLDDGSFAVPLQADRPDWRRGPNIGATPGNQGFFMVASAGE